MLVFIQWENSTPILLEQVGDDMTIEEVMEFATERCSTTHRVKSVSLIKGHWLVKMINLEVKHERVNG